MKIIFTILNIQIIITLLLHVVYGIKIVNKASKVEISNPNEKPLLPLCPRDFFSAVNSTFLLHHKEIISNVLNCMHMSRKKINKMADII